MGGIIKSTGRTFQILEHFETVCRPMALKEIAGHFDWPISSTAALLKSLLLLGYLDYDRFSQTYMPTMRLSTLGHWVGEALFQNNSVLDLMRTLHEATGETITLGTQSDLHAQHVHVLPSSHPVQVVMRPGVVRSLTRSGLGSLLLSARSDDMIELLLRRCNILEPNPENKVKLPELMARVNQVRRQGFVHVSNAIAPGVSIVGMLIPTTNLNRVFSINVL
ncbi:MAG: transcriptional regulator, partial [Alphaproteobacteria bacterium]